MSVMPAVGHPACAECVRFDLSGAQPVRSIALAASRLTDVSLAAIIGPGRDRRLCRIRFGVVHVARQRGRSLAAIGRALSRDHATILSAARRAEELIGSDPEFARYCATLKEVC